MSDITDRLRGLVPHCEDHDDYTEDDLLILQSAKEIERLREALAETRCFALSGEMDTIVSDEIERLRAALRQSVHVVQSEIEYCKDHTTAWFKLCVATREKALAALGGKE